MESELVTQYTIDDIYVVLSNQSDLLASIDVTLDYILAIILLVLLISFLWTLFSKWLFGGV